MSKRERNRLLTNFHFPIELAVLLLVLLSVTCKTNGQVTEKFSCNSNDCCDHHEWCTFWAEQGECDNNEEWMSSKCQIACKACHKNEKENNADPGCGITKCPFSGIHTKSTTGATPNEVLEAPNVNENNQGATNIPAVTPAEPTTPGLNLTNDDIPLVPPPSVDSIASSTETNTPTFFNESTVSKRSPGPPAIVPPPGYQVKIEKDVKIPEAMVHGGPKTLFTNDYGKCEQIRRNNPVNSPNILTETTNNDVVVEEENTNNKMIMSREDIMVANQDHGCVPRQASAECQANMCFNLRFRTVDGTCNNLQNPLWGAAQMPYLTSRNQVYDDNADAPRGWLKHNLPSPRTISRTILGSNALVPHDRYNSLMMQFGQLLVHDVLKTSLLPFQQCSGCKVIDGLCTPMDVDQDDPRFGCKDPHCCLPFTRSSSICGSSPRAQLSENTAFIDASMIYGSNMPDSMFLRNGGFLRASIVNGHFFLPFDPNQCQDNVDCIPLFGGGDNRTALFAGLAAVHSLLLREHNRIGEQLHNINPHWGSDRLYQETRKIVGAEMEYITFNEWLPRVLGVEHSRRVGPYNGYDESVNPTISAQFALAAMRFGHGMLQENYLRIDENGKPIENFGSLTLEAGVLKPQRLIFEGGVDPLLRGMMNIPVKRPQRITPTLTENLFGGADLAAQNIQRARDAGLPSYNTWREFCGMRRGNYVEDLTNEIKDPIMRDLLRTTYQSVDDIDLYTAVIVEDPVQDGLIGPTGACLLAEQFKRLRDGDRFWYQNPSTFTNEQIAEVESASFAKLICDNTETFSNSIWPNGFDLPSPWNQARSCNSLPFVDLSKWKEVLPTPPPPPPPPSPPTN